MKTRNKTPINSFLSNPLNQKPPNYHFGLFCHLSSLPLPTHHKPSSIYTKLFVPQDGLLDGSNNKCCFLSAWIVHPQLRNPAHPFETQLKYYFLFKAFLYSLKTCLSLHSLQTSTKNIKIDRGYYLLLSTSLHKTVRSTVLKKKTILLFVSLVTGHSKSISNKWSHVVNLSFSHASWTRNSKWGSSGGRSLLSLLLS